MKKIIKGVNAPSSLTTYIDQNPLHKYKDIDLNNTHVRKDIREHCCKEQYYICAYCCNTITGNSIDTHNEHIIPQESPQGQNLTLSIKNIVASCNSRVHCGHFKADNSIDLTPFIDECESEIQYNLNGKIYHKSPRAQSTITTLGLRNSSLQRTRAQMIDLAIFAYVEDITNLVLEEEDYLNLIIEDLETPIDGKLQAFTPVIVNVLKKYIR